MNILDQYTFELLNELNNNNVEYIVVGGYAVNYYGYIRTTGDIDLWIKPDNGINKTNLIKAFEKLGIDKSQLFDLEKLDFTKPLVFVDGIAPFQIDFITIIDGVKFEDAWNAKVIQKIDTINIPFIHLNHLILSKITSDRLKDKLDVETLQKIQKARKL